MRELALLTFITLDGVMQAPYTENEDRSGDFSSAGWARPCWDSVMAQVGVEAMAEPYDLLLGRRTYDIFNQAHSSEQSTTQDDPMTNATKYVATSNPNSLTWQNTIALTGDIVTEVARLKTQDGPLLQVHGSWALIQTLLDADLVDEYRLWTFPIVVGGGKRLFPDHGPRIELTLHKSAQAGNSGAVMTIYRRAQP